MMSRRIFDGGSFARLGAALTGVVALCAVYAEAPVHRTGEQPRAFAVTNRETAEIQVPFFPSERDEVRQGFVRVINRSAESGEILVHPRDDEGWGYPPLTLEIAGGETVHFNSDDLAMGNPEKGLHGSASYGDGDWRLRFESDLDIEVLAYIRTRDGFLTAMHDLAPREGNYLHVPVFNPGRNARQRSLLRLTNHTRETLEVGIVGIDDKGRIPGEGVRLSVPRHASRTLDATQLESGDLELDGKLGIGAGKWRLLITPVEGLSAMSLLMSPTGHLTNLSTGIVSGTRSLPDRGAETGFSPPRPIDPNAGRRLNVNAADIDGDGDLDVLLSSEDPGVISWYENLGDGEFSGQRVITTDAAYADSVSAADLDGDGDADVIFTSDGGNGLAWLENRGDGTFGPLRVISRLGVTVLSPEPAVDLDGDGDLDLLVIWNADNEAAWFENRGGGSFSERRTISSPGNQLHTARAADLDGDGDPDVLVGAHDGEVTWHENLGGGSFAEARTITADLISHVEPADLDGDGDLDLLTTYRGSFHFNDGNVAWYENLGDASFSPRRLIAANTNRTWTVFPADLDGDGDLDLYSLTDETRTLIWFENYGDGYFSSERVVQSNAGTLQSVVAADLDGDGRLDLLVPHGGGVAWYGNLGMVTEPIAAPANVRVLEGVGQFWVTWEDIADADDGGSPVTAYVATAVPQAGGESRSCTSDLGNGCTIHELAPGTAYEISVAAHNRAGHGPPSVAVTGTPISDPGTEVAFSAANTVSLEGEGAIDLVPEDLDGDGDPDLIVASQGSGELAWFENVDGAFPNREVIAAPFTRAAVLHAADLDGDGRADILAASPDDDSIAWYRNLGGGAFSAQGAIATNGWGVASIDTADLDGDGDLDVLAGSAYDGQLAWLENLGSSFSPFGARPIETRVAWIGAAHTEDLDADGNVDVLYASSVPDALVWRANLGGGAFSGTRSINTQGASGIRTGDVDGDGDPDVVIASEVDSAIAWYENLGGGAFSGKRLVEVLWLRGNEKVSARIVDFDGDGDPDLLHSARWGDSLAWSENLGGGLFSGRRSIGGLNGIERLGAADVDGDGDPDALYASRNQGEIGWHENLARVTATTAESASGRGGGSP